MKARGRREDELAVSEVIGVVMLLAMVVSMMGGVFLILTPYVNDFQDNSAWASANGISERLDGRFEVVGGASEGVGLKTTIATPSSSISPLLNAEEWIVAADLTATEAVTVTYLNESAFSIIAENESAVAASIWTPDGQERITFEASNEEITINHSLDVLNLYIIDIEDDQGVVLHRQAKIVLSGIMIKTSVQGGEHDIALVNDCRYDRFSNEPWTIGQRPDVAIDELFDGTMRASFSLMDVRVDGAMPSGSRIIMDIESKGPLTIFSGDAWNFRFQYLSTLDDTLTPQMNEDWLMDYTLNRASGTLDLHRGVSPWLRASGADGMTIDGERMIDLEIEFQRIEVSK